MELGTSKEALLERARLLLKSIQHGGRALNQPACPQCGWIYPEHAYTCVLEKLLEDLEAVK
jgi:hypothetical protein